MLANFGDIKDKLMIYINLERELLDEELWSIRPALKLPIKVQLLIAKEQIKQDIWDVSKKP
ncbi:hypothetical protein H6G80_13450 [Nostoc sp. FACHB-87]|uniref:hypothetical protein n=1 Tax=Nostocales TaxID=1161 RepID=UPI001685FEF2|nr:MULTISPECIES: hypothetical protein [Nostocales]MBD2300838.1 hypothetical protein [Nostoc sp. FACHB-190]MBD2455088.1 hypothetical protein [Nostoc sp. FACHB-87]MBD2477905.1 hypothetical protein [Anabaena sp. FACHB-83]MBD2487316.1 hypothetical protein [Aulosira sp. FACHB-615]